MITTIKDEAHIKKIFDEVEDSCAANILMLRELVPSLHIEAIAFYAVMKTIEKEEDITLVDVNGTYELMLLQYILADGNMIMDALETRQ